MLVSVSELVFLTYAWSYFTHTLTQLDKHVGCIHIFTLFYRATSLRECVCNPGWIILLHFSELHPRPPPSTRVCMHPSPWRWAVVLHHGAARGGNIRGTLHSLPRVSRGVGAPSQRQACQQAQAWLHYIWPENQVIRQRLVSPHFEFV